MKTLKQEWREECLIENKNTTFGVGTDVGCITLIPLSVVKKYKAISGDDGSFITNNYFSGSYLFSYETYYNDERSTQTIKLKGEYFFGDPCQCIPNDMWREFCEKELDDPKTKVIILKTGGDGYFNGSITQLK